MRNLSSRTKLVATAIFSLSSLAACASNNVSGASASLSQPTQGRSVAMSPAAGLATQAAPASTMSLGDAAAAPLGYLNFCARDPEECGIADNRDGVGDRQRELYARYYWPFAFAPSSAGARLIPTSGDTAPTARPAPGQRYDWSAIFGPSAASAVKATPAVWTRPAQAGPMLTWVSKAEVDQSAPEAADTAPAPSPAQDAPRAFAPAPGFAATLEAAPAVSPIATTPDTMRLLASVNDQINDAIRYVPARDIYGIDDYWALPLESGGPAAGDCKDYVLEKHRSLEAAGVPAGDLSIAIVRTSWGETHAVLLVATDRGELVLDSLTSRILPWQKARYTWLQRQAPGQQLLWVKIDSAGRRA